MYYRDIDLAPLYVNVDNFRRGKISPYDQVREPSAHYHICINIQSETLLICREHKNNKWMKMDCGLLCKVE